MEQSTITLEINIARPVFQFLWLKTVRGFDPHKHCARSLIGEYHPGIPYDLKSVEHIKLDLPDISREHPDTHFYLCGVVKGRNWIKNVHLPLTVISDEEAEFMNTHAWVYADANIDIHCVNPRLIPHPVRAIKPTIETRPEFTTCRNWQWGMQHFGHAEVDATQTQAHSLINVKACAAWRTIPVYRQDNATRDLVFPVPVPRGQEKFTPIKDLPSS